MPSRTIVRAMKTLIEPFRIKVVEPIRMTTPQERETALREAHFNLFGIPADQVLIDLLTDSGTGAMSAEQWAGIMRADESYAGAVSYRRFREAVERVTGFTLVLPTHQGRASERILFELLGRPGTVVPNNGHFDTTRANVEHTGARAIDLPGRDPAFKGNMDVERLESLIAEVGADAVPAVFVTVTNNTGGGQPVSMSNLRQVREVCTRHGIPFFLDACRFAENAYFIKLREEGYADRSVASIVREMFDLVDGATISAKKDGLVNIGGLLLLRDEDLFRRASELLILTEGYVTYGGLAGRDLEAMAQGLVEVLDEDYLRYRLRSAEYLAQGLAALGVPVLEPAGGHAVYIDAARFCPHIPPEALPGQAVACGLYRLAGIRSCEIGTLMFGGPGRPSPSAELVRLALPRRVYTQSHIDYVIEACGELYAARDRLRGFRVVSEPSTLRHFTAKLEELPPAG